MIIGFIIGFVGAEIHSHKKSKYEVNDSSIMIEEDENQKFEKETPQETLPKIEEVTKNEYNPLSDGAVRIIIYRNHSIGIDNYGQVVILP
jgi:hypothetical protein